MSKVNQRYVFPKSANYVHFYLGAGTFFFVLCLIGIIWYWFSPKHLNVGYQPEQPIPYSHRLHVGELGIDCRYCHSQVEKAAHASIPSTETCLNCHRVIKKDSPHILKLREAHAQNKPIEWVRIHRLPDHAYFDHSAHINKGVSCVSCHGRIDQMDIVYQAKSLSMGWCLECHRNPEEFVRPKGDVTKMDWEPGKDQVELGKELVLKHNIHPREDCAVCHR